MGINIPSLAKILLGIGLGVLAVSCLTATIIFGRYANHFSLKEKNLIKISFDSSSSMLDSSIAIAFFGCMSAVFAIATIVLTIIFEKQTLILIIVGGISSIFAFGCIVAEGVFTQKSLDNALITYARYDGIDLAGYSHKGAQKYIKNALKDLYEQAVPNLKYHNQKLKDVDFPSWSHIEKNMIGKNIDGKIITYSDLWPNYEMAPKDLPVSFYLKNQVIYAKSKEDDTKDAPIASIYFIYTGDLQNKKQICWPNSDRSNLNCKILNTYKEYKNDYYFPDVNNDYYFFEKYPKFFLNENIVVGSYLSYKQQDDSGIEADYEVENFPASFAILPTGSFGSSITKKTTEDSTNHYKVSGKKWAKAIYEEKKDAVIYLNQFTLVPHKMKNYHEYEFKSGSYKGEKYESGTYFYSDYQFNDGFLVGSFEYNYKDSNKGKVLPHIKKHSKRFINEYLSPSKVLNNTNSDLYQFALMNMIIQIFAILFWVGGRFIPTGEKDEKQKSQSQDEEPQQKVQEEA